MTGSPGVSGPRSTAMAWWRARGPWPSRCWTGCWRTRISPSRRRSRWTGWTLPPRWRRAAWRTLSPPDGAATLVAFTAAAVAAAPLPEAPRRWLVTGGGRRNPAIMHALRARLGAAGRSRGSSRLGRRRAGGAVLRVPRRTHAGGIANQLARHHGSPTTDARRPDGQARACLIQQATRRCRSMPHLSWRRRFCRWVLYQLSSTQPIRHGRACPGHRSQRDANDGAAGAFASDHRVARRGWRRCWPWRCCSRRSPSF